MSRVRTNVSVTVPDLQQALARQNLTLQPGDVVIINTGWHKLWGKGNLPLANDGFVTHTLVSRIGQRRGNEGG